MIKNYNRGDQTQSLKGASRRRSSRGRRHVFVGSACVCAVIIALGVSANTTLPWVANVISSKQPQPIDVQEMRIGTIEVQTGQDQCDLLKFDNETGRTINEFKVAMAMSCSMPTAFLFLWAPFIGSIDQ